ncbi:MAG: hypothetical protein J7K33_09890 [Candidatus Marinimicrobia bacterium]|nr:hypothetical protein [Candidatus Neomarinimicrobiota bacterium]
MVEVEIKIEASSKDPYARYHAVAIDEDLMSVFWKNQPDKIVKTAAGKFNYVKKVDLEPGRHYVVYGVSAPCKDPYYWHAKIYINGREVISSGRVCSGNYLEAYFTVPFLPVINKIISGITRISFFGLLKTIAGGKFLKKGKKKSKS